MSHYDCRQAAVNKGTVLAFNQTTTMTENFSRKEINTE